MGRLGKRKRMRADSNWNAYNRNFARFSQVADASCLAVRPVSASGPTSPISPRTKAILAVHLLGNAADMAKIMRIAKRRNLKVIEDCAQSPGVRFNNSYVGTIGDIGVFSFQETKNITTGEGGMLVTKSPVLAKRARLIRNHGESVPLNSWKNNMLANRIGMNFRMTELTAAIGL